MFSIGILGCNAEAVVASALKSLLRQNIFQHLTSLEVECELLYLAFGCSDSTGEIAQEILEQVQGPRLQSVYFRYQLYVFQRLSKTETWNRFVHELSSESSQLLLVIDGDVILLDPDALINIYHAFTNSDPFAPEIDLATGRIAVKFPDEPPGRLRAKGLSLPQVDDSGSQLYCMRSSAARKIWIPKDLPCCEYQYIRRAIISDIFTGPELHKEATVTSGISNIFRVKLSVCQTIRARKQQIIGQTVIHLLINNYIHALSSAQRLDLKNLLESNDKTQPGWLKLLIFEHISRTRYFWQVYPGLLRHSIDNNSFSNGSHCDLKSRLYSMVSIIIACFAAARFLKRGHVHYWPDDPTVESGDSVAGIGVTRTSPSLASQSAPSLGLDLSETNGD